MFIRKKVDYKDIRIHYSIQSSLGTKGNYRYQQHITGTICIADNESADSSLKQVGKIEGYKLLIDTGYNNNWGAYPIYDTDGHIAHIGKVIYDCDNEVFNPLLEMYFGGIIERDILILSRIEILAEYRDNKIGTYAVKDFYNNFIQGCGLMVLECIPGRNDDEVNHKMLAFYQKIGFHFIPELSGELLFLCPDFVNRIFDKIRLD